MTKHLNFTEENYSWKKKNSMPPCSLKQISRKEKKQLYGNGGAYDLKLSK